MRVFPLRYDVDSGWSGPVPDVDPRHSLTLCFGAARFLDDTDPMRELDTGGAMVGCSTAGEIFGPEVSDDSVSAAVVEFEATPVRFAATEVTGLSSYDAGVSLARSLIDDDLRALFVLSDGLDVNGTDLVRGINTIVPPETVVTGGLAGDGPRFERTSVVVDGKPASGYATAVGLYGNKVRVGHGSKGGWDKFGPERTVTRSRGNVVYELDGRPILGLYKEYLGDLASELPAAGLLFPLSLREPGSEKHLVRTILAMDEGEQSLTFAGDIPQGHSVQLMQANFDRLVDGAEDAAIAAAEGSTDASLSIAISCVGRRLVLGERAEDELEATMEMLPAGITQIGFYSYGEISPYTMGSCDLHNQTMTLTSVGEAP